MNKTEMSARRQTVELSVEDMLHLEAVERMLHKAELADAIRENNENIKRAVRGPKWREQ